MIAGEHVANMFTGQVFFDDDDVDVDAFATRAARMGFDEQAYIEALRRVPVISHESLEKRIAFLSDFVGMLGEMGLSALMRDQEHERLRESERRYRDLFDNATEGLLVFAPNYDREGTLVDLEVVDVNPGLSARMHADREELVGRRLSAGREHAVRNDADSAVHLVDARDDSVPGPAPPVNETTVTDEVNDTDERLATYVEFVVDAVRSGEAARGELYLQHARAYELLSAYPSGSDRWALSATDVTELREAEAALRRQEEHIRRAYVDVLDAVTGGKLILLTDRELQAELGEPLDDTVTFSSAEEIAEARRRIADVAEAHYPGRVLRSTLLHAVSEALENALKHADGGTYQVFACDGFMQVAVVDEGPGIDFRTLPRATLVRGFSTAASLGMGFTIMLQLCERVLLDTRPGHTAVVLEIALDGIEESTAGVREE
jgi:anti-sigma regulatory factor (Ser/Thr protein kinase)